MAKKKKLLTTVVAVATAAALLLSGTFAWQSINQTALNEASDVINPGGRLHDDFDGTNKDVYVENFAEEDIFARIQLSEYFEIVLNYGTAGEKTETIVGSKTTDENGNVTYGYDTHYFGGVADDAHDYWTWETGGQTIYMPTFNKNKDSLEADLNGNYVDAIGGISNRDGTQYTNYTDYSLTENSVKTASAIYDIDGNMADELAQGGVDISDLIENGNLPAGYENSVALVSETHETNYTLGATLISMEEWKTDYNSEPGEYWVYDTDGWVYWAQAIKPGTATGLLLDGIELNQVMDDTWYYAINVVAQFVTAGDTGSTEDGTGFYDTDKGSAPSADALTLLDKIGVNDTTPGTDAGETDPDEIQTLTLTADGANSVTIASGDSIKLEAEDGADLSFITVTDVDGDPATDWEYDPETGIVEIYDDGYSPYTISDATGTYTGTVNIEGNSQDPDEMQTLTLTADGTNSVTISSGDSVKIVNDNGEVPSEVYVDGFEWDTDSDWTYDADTGILIITGTSGSYSIEDAEADYYGTVNIEGNSQDPDEMQTLYLTVEGGNVVYINHGESVIIAAEDGADLSSILVDENAWDETSDWTYDPDTGILTLNGPDSYYDISDATNTYTGTVNFENDSYEEKIYLHTYIHDNSSPEVYDADFIKPGQSYTVYVDIATEDMASVPEGFDIAAATPVLSFTGTPIDGEEYELNTGHYTLGDWSGFEAFDEGDGNTGYRTTAPLTVNEAVDYGTTINMVSTIEGYENAFDSWKDYVVSDFAVDGDAVTIDLYDPNGNKLTDNTVQENTTYDIVVTMNYNNENIVIHSTNDTNATVSDRVDATVGLQVYTHYPDALADVNNFIINDDGQLVVGKDSDPNVGWEEYGHDQYLDDLTISFLVGDLLIDKDSDTETHCYVYDERHQFFPDEETFFIDVPDLEIQDYENDLYVILNDGPKQVIVYGEVDRYNNNITEQVTITIDGKIDENTKIEKAEDGNYYLTLGENETSEEITITAEIDGRGKGSKKIQIAYATVQVNNETLTKGEYSYEYYAEGAGDYTFSLKEGTEATWSLEEGATENVALNSETGVLTVTDDGTATFASCTVKATIPYNEESVEIYISVSITIPAAETTESTGGAE